MTGSVARWFRRRLPLFGRVGALQGSTLIDQFGPFAENNPGENCSAFPEACEQPFNCVPHTLEATLEDLPLTRQIATYDGHANYHAWCWRGTKYIRYAQQCLVGNVKEAASHLRAIHMQGPKTNLAFDAWAQYCFAANHCNNTLVHENTTIMEAETVCDEMYSRFGWTTGGFTSLLLGPGMQGHFNAWGQAACAMGVFHCDVQHCRQYYCEDESWASKYGHLASPMFEVEHVVDRHEYW